MWAAGQTGVVDVCAQEVWTLKIRDVQHTYEPREQKNRMHSVMCLHERHCFTRLLSPGNRKNCMYSTLQKIKNPVDGGGKEGGEEE